MLSNSSILTKKIRKRDQCMGKMVGIEVLTNEMKREDGFFNNRFVSLLFVL
jgi:hypothetical protein